MHVHTPPGYMHSLDDAPREKKIQIKSLSTLHNSNCFENIEMVLLVVGCSIVKVQLPLIYMPASTMLGVRGRHLMN